nr:TRAV10 [Sphenodon punctatus]
MVSKACRSHWRHLIGLLILCTEINGDISQPPEVSVSVGETARIPCDLDTPSQNGFFWHKWNPGTAPELIIFTYGEKKQDRHLTVEVGQASKSTTLLIDMIEMEDAGFYYCAVVLYNNAVGKLTFGRGTRLDVTPNLQKSEPSVYELESTNKSHPLSACLFTDYFPGNINVSATGSDLVGIESSVVVVEDQASYGAVLWQNANENLQCIANYDGEDIQAKKDIADSCSGTQMSFQTDERLNLLSLTVLGLRVIFFKSVAVNLLLTFRLWSR